MDRPAQGLYLIDTIVTFQIPDIPDVTDARHRIALQTLLDNKTKPLGSLGQLESLACQLGEILQTHSPVLVQPQMLVFAGDHGLAAQGVSAYPSDVTWQMVENFLAGGAAVSVLARQHGIALTVVDCGVRHEFLAAGQQSRAGLLVRKIALGTADASLQAAMSAAQCNAAMVMAQPCCAICPAMCCCWAKWVSATRPRRRCCWRA